jgi:hypothetical protein
MKASRWTANGAVGIFFFAALFAAGFSSGEQAPALRSGETVPGFGNLRWGDSVEQASKAYPALQFSGYRMANGKEEPWKAYSIKGDPCRVDNVLFESIEYWFRADRFERVRAVLRSKIGPRTLVTQAEESYDRIFDRLSRQYGGPAEHKVSYRSEYLAIVKETRWAAGGVFMRLTYKGPEDGNEDVLVFEMGK